jgi:hypothetical protein
MLGPVVVTDDRNLAGELGDGDRVATAAPTVSPSGDRRGPKGSVPGQ